MFDLYEDKIYEAGVLEYGFISPSDIEYRQMIRDICAGNGCGRYGKTWACPPAVGTVEECRERCLHYDTMMVFTGLYILDDAFDYEGMQQGMSAFKNTARNLEKVLSPLLGNHQVLSNESCNKCTECTYPNEPCRFPDQLHHSIEGYGILVSDLAQKAGVSYSNGENTITFFGAVLFNKLSALKNC